VRRLASASVVHERKTTTTRTSTYTPTLHSPSVSTPTMAANGAVTFHAVLERIGLNAATHKTLNNNRFNKILDLITVQEKDLDHLPKHLERHHDAVVPAADQVHIPLSSVSRS
jgi:hypothetical protein